MAFNTDTSSSHEINGNSFIERDTKPDSKKPNKDTKDTVLPKLDMTEQLTAERSKVLLAILKETLDPGTTIESSVRLSGKLTREIRNQPFYEGGFNVNPMFKLKIDKKLITKPITTHSDFVSKVIIEATQTSTEVSDPVDPRVIVKGKKSVTIPSDIDITNDSSKVLDIVNNSPVEVSTIAVLKREGGVLIGGPAASSGLIRKVDGNFFLIDPNSKKELPLVFDENTVGFKDFLRSFPSSISPQISPPYQVIGIAIIKQQTRIVGMKVSEIEKMTKENRDTTPLT